jgi:hypothetical protein
VLLCMTGEPARIGFARRHPLPDAGPCVGARCRAAQPQHTLRSPLYCNCSAGAPAHGLQEVHHSVKRAAASLRAPPQPASPPFPGHHPSQPALPSQGTTPASRPSLPRAPPQPAGPPFPGHHPSCAGSHVHRYLVSDPRAAQCSAAQHNASFVCLVCPCGRPLSIANETCIKHPLPCLEAFPAKPFPYALALASDVQVAALPPPHLPQQNICCILYSHAAAPTAGTFEQYPPLLYFHSCTFLPPRSIPYPCLLVCPAGPALSVKVKRESELSGWVGVGSHLLLCRYPVPLVTPSTSSTPGPQLLRTGCQCTTAVVLLVPHTFCCTCCLATCLWLTSNCGLTFFIRSPDSSPCPALLYPSAYRTSLLAIPSLHAAAKLCALFAACTIKRGDEPFQAAPAGSLAGQGRCRGALEDWVQR